jgi:hypothetical protein
MTSNEVRSYPPWRKYETGNAEWIKTTEWPVLAEHIRKHGGKMKLGQHVYQVKDGWRYDFIVRYPIQSNQARNKEDPAE